MSGPREWREQTQRGAAEAASEATSGKPDTPQQPTTLVSVDGGRAFGEVAAAMEIARKNPRDPRAARRRALEMLESYELADACVYELAFGSQPVVDGSADLARLLAMCWTNTWSGFRIVAESATDRTVEGWAIDLETNRQVTNQVEFKKAYQKSQGRGKPAAWVPTDDPQRLLLETNKNGAKAERNALHAILPERLWLDCVEAAKERKKAGSNDRSLEEHRVVMLDNYARLGVFDIALERRFGKPIERFAVEDFAAAESLYRAIQNGAAQLEVEFDTSPITGAEAKAGIERDRAARQQEQAAAKSEQRDANAVKLAWNKLVARYKAAKERDPSLESEWRRALEANGIKRSSDITTVDQVRSIEQAAFPPEGAA